MSIWLLMRLSGTFPEPLDCRMMCQTTLISRTSRLAGEYAAVGLVEFALQSLGGSARAMASSTDGVRHRT